MLVDSVVPTNSISQPTPVTEKKNRYLLMKETVNRFSTPSQVDF